MTYLPAAAATIAAGIRMPAKAAKAAFSELMALPVDWRAEYLAGLDRYDLAQIMHAAYVEAGSQYALWADDPVGFAEFILGETTWSAQQDILRGLVTPGVHSIAVPAGFGLGKTHIGGVAVCWFSAVNPVGTALTVTTATRMRQVQRQLWPHVRRLAAKGNLPGDVDMTQWKMPDPYGVETPVAYGFSAPKDDEAAMQGIHAPRILLIVDEAGGIGRTIGAATRNLLTGSDARMLAIGNPPTDDEGGWFETLCEAGADTARPEVITIAIPATSSPSITKEDTGPCKACPPQVPAHGIGLHLVDQAWVDDAIREHTEESPYVQAKVYAKFPKGGASRAIPAAYIDAAVESLSLPDATEFTVAGQWWDPEDACDGHPSTDNAGKPYALQPPMGAIVDLGVDVAADGGDELVIARLEGDVARIRLIQSGAVNENAVDVAGKILEEIRAADTLRRALGTERKVHVKVDSIGVGWGVVSTLEAWGSEGLHDAVIVRVTVSEAPDRPDNPKAMWRPLNKRAEMWLNGREVFKPDETTGRPRLRLDVDGRTAAQLRAPMYGTNTSGRTVIERKVDMKSRGVSSPDRAEAVLLAAYVPKVKRPARIRA